MREPTPLNRDEKRKQKAPKAAKPLAFKVVHHNRFEEQGADGMVMARNVFRVVSPDGSTLCEDTPTGPMPVLLMSVPQPVRKSVVTPPLVRA